MVRLGPRDYRVECTVCRKNNTGPNKTRISALREWHRPMDLGLLDRLAGERYGKTWEALGWPEAAEILANLREKERTSHGVHRKTGGAGGGDRRGDAGPVVGLGELQGPDRGGVQR